MPKFQKHIFVCSNRREPGHSRGCCDCEGKEALRNALKKEIKQHQLGPLVRANKAGCLDQCEYGPVVVIYPQQIWYGNVQLEDVPRIVERSIINDEVIEDLLIPDADLNTKGRRSVSSDDIAGQEAS